MEDDIEEEVDAAPEQSWQAEHRLWSNQFSFSEKERLELEREENERVTRLIQEQNRRLGRIRMENAHYRQETAAEKFALVLRQTEIFGSMLAGVSPLLELSSKKRTGRRGRSEKEGDEELMRECEDANRVSRLLDTPKYLRGELRSYQLEGVNFLIRLFDCCINGVLADEMGLGKTFQTIALLGYLKFSRGLCGPHLIVAPKSVVPNWIKEIRRWCPGLSALKFHGDKEERVYLRQQELTSGRYDCIVTTYEMVSKEKGALQKMRFRYIIVDEAHRLKNETSLLSSILRLMHSSHRLLITGTPLQNNLHELWALLNYLLPQVFDDGEAFDDWFNIKDGHSETSVVLQLHKLLKPFMLRRLKSDVEGSLPPKKEIYVGCGLTKMQREWYTKILTRDAAVVNGNSASRVALLNIVMQLRKVCNHPYLFEGAEEGPPFITDEHIIQNSGKMIMLDKLLTRLQSQGSRVLLFCQMTRMLDILEDYLRFRGFEYCRLDGSTHGDEREEMTEAFNKEGSTKFIFILSTRAGGLGINLATANTVILYDSDWNPQMDLQAQDRAHRIGQKKPVTVFRFVSEGSIEEKIYQRAVKKLYLDAAVIQQGRLQEQNKALNKDDLLAMVRWGAEEMFSVKDIDITDEDIDRVLERGAEVVKNLENTMKQNCQMNLLNFSLNIEDSNLYYFEGVDYSQTPTKSIYVSGINVQVTEEDIRQAFDPFGEVRKVVISPERDKALVQYKRLESAISAFTNSERIALTKCPDFRLAYGNKNMTIITGDMMAQATQSQPSRRDRNRLATQELMRSPVQDPKLPKVPQYHDFQFFDVSRLRYFHEKECAFVTAQWEKKMHDRHRRPETSPVKDCSADQSDEEAERWLTPQEEAELKQLQADGFSDWSRRDYQAFVRLCEKHGRKNVESIAAEMECKTAEDVRRYSHAFWTKGPHMLQDWDKVLKRIEKGEASLQRRNHIGEILTWKTSLYLNPWSDLVVPYVYASKNRPNPSPQTSEEREVTPIRQFTETEDRFLICMTAAVGYGEWDRIKAELRRCWEFRFNYYITSRSVVDLARRIDQLVKMLERERLESKRKKPIVQRPSKTKKRPAPKEKKDNEEGGDQDLADKETSGDAAEFAPDGDNLEDGCSGQVTREPPAKKMKKLKVLCQPGVQTAPPETDTCDQGSEVHSNAKDDITKMDEDMEDADEEMGEGNDDEDPGHDSCSDADVNDDMDDVGQLDGGGTEVVVSGDPEGGKQAIPNVDNCPEDGLQSDHLAKDAEPDMPIVPCNVPKGPGAVSPPWLEFGLNTGGAAISEPAMNEVPNTGGAATSEFPTGMVPSTARAAISEFTADMAPNTGGASISEFTADMVPSTVGAAISEFTADMDPNTVGAAISELTADTVLNADGVVTSGFTTDVVLSTGTTCPPCTIPPEVLLNTQPWCYAAAFPSEPSGRASASSVPQCPLPLPDEYSSAPVLPYAILSVPSMSPPSDLALDTRPPDLNDLSGKTET